MFESLQRSNWQGTVVWISTLFLAFFLQSGIAQGSPQGKAAKFTDASNNHVTAKLTATKPRT